MSPETTSPVQLAIGPMLANALMLAYCTRRKPVLVVGPSGIRKAECIVATAAAHDLGVRVLDLCPFVRSTYRHHRATKSHTPGSLPALPATTSRALALLHRGDLKHHFTPHPRHCCSPPTDAPRSSSGGDHSCPTDPPSNDSRAPG